MIAPKLPCMRFISLICSAGPIQRLGCLVLLCLWLPTASWAHDRILEKAYWTDSSGVATFEQARSASYTPYSGVLSKGFNPHAQWVRLKVDGVPSGSDTLVLRIRPVFLDSITLYDPLELAQGRVPRTTGDRTPFQATEFESLNHTFVIPAQPGPREVWLRLSTTSTQLMQVEALTPREMLREEHTLWLAYSALLAVIFSCLLWVFTSWLQDRDPVNGMFVLRQTILLIYTACYLGYHRILLDGVMSAVGQDLLYCWVLLMTTGLTFLFEFRLLREYMISTWGTRLLQACIGTSVVLMLLLLTGSKELALLGNTVITGLGILCMLLTAIGIQPRTPDLAQPHKSYLLPKPVILAYYSFVLGVLGVSIMPSLGLLQGSTMSIYGVLLYGLLSGLFMTALLIVRSRQMERLRREQANHLYLSREQLTIETRRRQDQSQLLNMLMHELKTPLAVIDMALKDRVVSDKTQGYVGRAIDNMKTILNRCVQTDRLVDRPFEVRCQPFDLAAQLQQWVNDNKQAAGRCVLDSVHTAPVDTDLQCVQIIASNLIENALKYGDPKEPVRVSLQTQAHGQGRAAWCLKVYSIPGAAGWPDADKVFAKYYRSAAAQSQSGTGLGLFLSHNLAQQLGAELRYQPTDTHICFELWLPT